MKDSTKIIIAVVLGIVFLLLVPHKDESSKIKHLERELAAAKAQVPVVHDTIFLKSGNKTEVATSPVAEADLHEMKRLLKENKNTLEALRINIKQVESFHTTAATTKDSVQAIYNDTNKTYSHRDEWSDIVFYTADTSFVYQVRDSIETIVEREYKHKFLWWRWGTKGYNVKIINHNPHSHFYYSKYIRHR